MTMDFRISVVIPSLAERRLFLKECLRSVFSQSLTPLEVIVVGHNLVIPAEYSRFVNLLKTHEKSNAAESRNHGARRAIGDYIAFLDDDDIWPSNYLQSNLPKISDRILDLGLAEIQNFSIDDQGNQHIEKSHHNKDLNQIFHLNPGIVGSNMIVKRDSFIKIGGFREALSTSEDKSLVIDFICGGFAVDFLGEAPAWIRNHSSFRLSNSVYLLIGVRSFYKLFKKKMPLASRLHNLNKISKLEFENFPTAINWVKRAVVFLYIHSVLNLLRLVRC